MKKNAFLYFIFILKDFCKLLKVNTNIYKGILLINILLIYGVTKCVFYLAIYGVSTSMLTFWDPDLKIRYQIDLG